MQTFLAILSLLLLAVGAFTVALNWMYVIANYRFYRQGSEQRISLIHLVPQLLAFVAAQLSSHMVAPLLPGWSFWLVAFADAGLLQILLHPVSLLRQKLRAQT